jgi:hypothetical protein
MSSAVIDGLKSSSIQNHSHPLSTVVGEIAKSSRKSFELGGTAANNTNQVESRAKSIVFKSSNNPPGLGTVKSSIDYNLTAATPTAHD